MTEKERERVKGLIINKFRGDKTILDPGIKMIEEKGKVPVTGIVPYMQLQLEDEDSLTDRFDHREKQMIDLAVVRYPRISNFTDFDVFEQSKDVSVRYVTTPEQIEAADILFLPGSKNTMGDMKWMRESGMESAVKKYAESGIVFGICGGYQMLGEKICDPENIEEGGEIRGLELLEIETILGSKKTRTQVKKGLNEIKGPLSCISKKKVEGYEIHMGVSRYSKGEQYIPLDEVLNKGNVYGTYIHGIFDEKGVASSVINELAKKKGMICHTGEFLSYKEFKETQYEKLADTLRSYLDMEQIYQMMGIEK